MNDKLSRARIEHFKESYPKGTRVELNSMSGENQMPAGAQGSVQFVDDIGQIHVAWDNGSSLALIPGEDSFSKIEQTYPKLQDILVAKFEDVHLCHKDVEIEPATIVELSNRTLTDEGKAEWADVLNAGVVSIYQGFYGLQMDLTGVSPKRLESFASMLAGYCSESNYEKWVAPEQNSDGQNMNL